MSGIENEASIEEKMRMPVTARAGAAIGTRMSRVSRPVEAPSWRAASRYESSVPRKAPSSRSAASPRCFQASAVAMPAHDDENDGTYGLQNTRSAWPTTTKGTKSGTFRRNSTGPKARTRSQPHTGIARQNVSAVPAAATAMV